MGWKKKTYKWYLVLYLRCNCGLLSYECKYMNRSGVFQNVPSSEHHKCPGGDVYLESAASFGVHTTYMSKTIISDRLVFIDDFYIARRSL